MIHTKTVYQKVTQIMNEDGELMSEDVKKFDVYVKDEEEFVFLYLKHMGIIYQLGGNDIKVLFYVGTNCDFNTNEITLGIAAKRRMSAVIGLKVGSINNAISRLTKRNFLTHRDTAQYKVSPEFVWKGYIKSREKDLAMFISYKIGDPQ